MTGRTPGALHSPLRRLCDERVVLKKPQPLDKPGRGRPSQIFQLNPEAGRALPKLTKKSGTRYPASNEAALRMLNRRLKKAFTENQSRARQNQARLTDLCSIEYGFLTEREALGVERKFQEIKTMLSRKRSDRTGTKKRFRVGMILVQDLQGD